MNPLNPIQEQDVNRVLGILTSLCYMASANKGFWSDYELMRTVVEAHAVEDRERLLKALEKMMIGQKLALMHSELSEALEGDRKDQPSDKLPGYSAVEEELADLLIRICDFSGRMRLRLGAAVCAKLGYNSGRPHMHGKHY